MTLDAAVYAQLHSQMSQALISDAAVVFLDAWKEIVPFNVALSAPHFSPQEVGSEAGAAVIVPRAEFSPNQAIWLAISETGRSIAQQDLRGWIVGGAVAVISWLFGGFTALIVSATGLAALNSLILVFTDIKLGRFSGTRTLSDLIQFFSFMMMIALGRLADYGVGDGTFIVLRTAMASLAVAVCFWRSFRGLVLLAGLEGLDELVEREIDLFMDWINQRRRRG